MSSRNHAGIPGSSLIFVFSVILIFLPAACYMGGPGGPAETSPGPLPETLPPLSPVDNPAAGEMSAGTAANILDYSSYGEGVQIGRLRNPEALKNYLAPPPRNIRSASAAAGISANTWIIKTIGGKPVLRIADRAFSPAGGAADITALVKIIKLPETLIYLGEFLFEGAGDSLVLDLPKTASLNDESLINAAKGSSITVQTSNPANSGETPILVVRGPPVLLQGPLVDYTQGPVTVSYTFNTTVIPSGFDTSSWDLSSAGDTVILRYTGSAEEPLAVGLRAAETSNGVTRTTDVSPVEVMPVTAVFQRPSPAKEYTLTYYSGDYDVARFGAGGSTRWYYISDTGLRALFNAIYSPNAPDTADAVEVPNQAVSYTAEISAAVLKLFKITIGALAGNDKVEIRGAGLPGVDGASSNKRIVIDIGIPDTDNRELPVFSIPDRDLGTPGGDYAHIRLRVNRGAELRIGGAPGVLNPPHYGNLKNGAVEVMGSGRLRDEVYEGFLGTGALVIARLGSYLGVGPQSSSFVCPAYDDWLISPAGGDGKIRWGTGDQNGSYIEIRQDGKIAFSADLTVRKSLSVKYKLWFVNGPILTVDAAGDTSVIDGRKGLFAGGAGYVFYGDYFNSGGENISRVEAKIIVQGGSEISRSFLTGENGFISGPARISNKGSGGSAPGEYGRDGIKGYPNWAVP